MKDIKYNDLELELKSNLEKIKNLENVIEVMKRVLLANDLQDEVPSLNLVSLEEQICLDGIRHIAELVKTHQYSEKDIKNFDILYKNLRVIKGEDLNKNKKQKKMNVKELLKIVEGS